MSDDYLWDGSGEPDPEVRRLEELLGRFRHEPERGVSLGGPAFPAEAREASRFRPALVRSRWAWVAAAAAAVAGIAALWLLARRPASGWEVVRIDGAPKIASGRIGGTRNLPVGGWVETDAASRAEIKIGFIGEATIEPSTRVRLLRAGPMEHRLALDRGTLHARIWAPPRLFYVETPSAVAVDLGCTYTLSVDDAGGSLLRVTAGWVAFELLGRESFVPAGAMCVTRPGIGPGTPCFEDASPALRDALVQLDFGREDAGVRARSLALVLEQARPRDALTLWHLLSRVQGEERARVYDRLVALTPPPAGVTREGILAGERRMMDLWWDELGLGVTTWWRLWKSPGPPQER